MIGYNTGVLDIRGLNEGVDASCGASVVEANRKEGKKACKVLDFE